MVGQSFGLVGRTFVSEAFEGMRQASIAARRARGGAWDAQVRPRPIWRGSGEPIAVASLPRKQPTLPAH